MNSEHALLLHQNTGDSFSGVYYVENVFTKQTRNGKDYLDLTLRDKSGSRYVKYWGVLTGIEKGSFVFVSANVEDYMGNPSIVSKNIEVVERPEDMSNYTPTYEDTESYAANFDEMREKLKVLETETGDSICGVLVDDIYGNSKFFEKFVVSPCSVRSHYGRIGGLLANTVRVAGAAMNVAGYYRLSSRERVILLTAALLHRIGAVDCYEIVDCMPVETKKGILLGLGNLTMTRLSSAIRRVVAKFQKEGIDMDQDIVVRILHAVSACDPSFLKPSTKEALLLGLVCKTDSDMVEAIEFIENDTNAGQEFTAYDPILKRRYFKGLDGKAS